MSEPPIKPPPMNHPSALPIPLSALSNQPLPIPYPQRTLKRAERALICSPFELALLRAMAVSSVPLQAIAGESGLSFGYTTRALTELKAETELLWLLQVGLLRREVDGQGLTDSFRITPLGRQILPDSPNKRRAGWGDRFYNALQRWARWPF
jgi:hypothetical protein